MGDFNCAIRFWDADSDRDHADQLDVHPKAVERACRRCGGMVWCSLTAPYVISPICDRCDREIRATQARAMDRRDEPGAA